MAVDKDLMRIWSEVKVLLRLGRHDLKRPFVVMTDWDAVNGNTVGSGPIGCLAMALAGEPCYKNGWHEPFNIFKPVPINAIGLL